MDELMHFDRAKQELALATKIDQVKEIRDRAEAFRIYAKQAGKTLEMQNYCAEIKIRAERKAGELIPDKFPHGGDRKSQSRLDEQTLKDAGISKFQSYSWRQIANVPEDKFESYIKDKIKSQGELTSIGIRKLAPKIKSEVGEIVPPEGKFEVIVIDPPWPYGTKYDPDTRRIASPYPEMDLEEIANIEIPTANDAILWLWTTHQFMHPAYHLLETWEFEPKIILTWKKNRMGMGVWLRSITEFCIMAVRGHPRINLTNETSLITGAVREHSRKPDSFYHILDTLCLGRAIDMFGRQPRSRKNGYTRDWVIWGSEIDKFKEDSSNELIES